VITRKEGFKKEISMKGGAGVGKVVAGTAGGKRKIGAVDRAGLRASKDTSAVGEDKAGKRSRRTVASNTSATSSRGSIGVIF
jgi:hypothetical protein